MILILTYYIRVWHESGVIFLFKKPAWTAHRRMPMASAKILQFVSRSLLMYLVRSSVGLLEMPRDWKFSSAIDREFATSLAASFDIFKMVFPFHPDWDWPLGAQNENKNFVYPSTCVHGNMNHARVARGIARGVGLHFPLSKSGKLFNSSYFNRACVGQKTIHSCRAVFLKVVNLFLRKPLRWQCLQAIVSSVSCVHRDIHEARLARGYASSNSKPGSHLWGKSHFTVSRKFQNLSIYRENYRFLPTPFLL